MFIRTGLILTATLLSLVTLFGQESKGPTQAERIVIDNPEVIKLELTPSTQKRRARVDEKPEPFAIRSKISFNLLGTNTSTFPLVVYGWDTFSQNRPLLFRNGQEVPYRTGLNDVLKSKDKEPAMEVIHLITTRLQPGEPTIIEKIDLNTWYGLIAPGSYELGLRHRFVHGRKWVESAVVAFEVPPLPK